MQMSFALIGKTRRSSASLNHVHITVRLLCQQREALQAYCCFPLYWDGFRAHLVNTVFQGWDKRNTAMSHHILLELNNRYTGTKYRRFLLNHEGAPKGFDLAESLWLLLSVLIKWLRMGWTEGKRGQNSHGKKTWTASQSKSNAQITEVD